MQDGKCFNWGGRRRPPPRTPRPRRVGKITAAAALRRSSPMPPVLLSRVRLVAVEQPGAPLAKEFAGGDRARKEGRQRRWAGGGRASQFRAVRLRVADCKREIHTPDQSPMLRDLSNSGSRTTKTTSSFLHCRVSTPQVLLLLLPAQLARANPTSKVCNIAVLFQEREKWRAF